MTREYSMLINGQAVAGDRDSLHVINPATEELLAAAPSCSTEQLDTAVDAARDAFDEWRSTDIDTRRDVVRRIADTVEAHADELAELLTSEQGKPLAVASAEVARAVQWARGLADITWESRVAVDDDKHRVVINHVPIGTVAAIVPWNFPVTLAMWKIAPALITGNTVVLKPSPFTPLTALRIGELVKDIVPAGVLNIVSGADDIGPAMTSHPGFDKVAFTGSSETGAKVMASAASTLKRVTLELGGNDAAIVLPDVDIASVAPKIFWGCFANSSQYCLAIKRVYVHDSIKDEFIAAMVEVAREVVVGNGLDPATQLGPIQNRTQFEKVMSFVDECRDSGFTIAYDGTPDHERGYFVGPIIVDSPPEDSRLVREEPFGPIVPVLSFSDPEDAVRKANSSNYGLGGSVWSADTEAAAELAAKIMSGVVWVNEVQQLGPEFPMGGHRHSGIGRENGLEGLLEYCNTQSLAIAKQ